MMAEVVVTMADIDKLMMWAAFYGAGCVALGWVLGRVSD